jgi:ABC-type transporter Mla subunit MlaD
MGTYKDKIASELELAWTPSPIYDSDNNSIADSAAEIAAAVSNSEHTALMDNMKAVMDSHKAMEDDLKSLLQYLSTFMSAFAAWVPTGTLSDAVHLKAACSSSASNIVSKCTSVGGKIDLLSDYLRDLSLDINSYKG